MNKCVKCGKSADVLWLSKSGFCEECAEAVYKEQQTQPSNAAQAWIQSQAAPATAAPATAAPAAPSQPRSPQRPVPGLFNVWFGLCIACVAIGFACLLAIGTVGGFSYVGGDAYNIQITATLSGSWFILAVLCAVIGSAVYIGEVIKYRK